MRSLLPAGVPFVWDLCLKRLSLPHGVLLVSSEFHRGRETGQQGRGLYSCRVLGD